MSLLESSQHAPLASAEKSLDKLEIELEERQELKKEVNGDGDVENDKDGCGNDNNDEKKKTSKEQQNGNKNDEEIAGGTTTTKVKSTSGRKPLFNIKISKLLGKSFNEKSSSTSELKEKEKPSEKKQIEYVKDDDDDDDDDRKAKEKLLPTTKGEGKDEDEKTSLVKDQIEVVGNESKTNEEEELNLGLKCGNQGETAAAESTSSTTNKGTTNILLESSTTTNNTSSFITTFSTPKWINFRRVFSFNRNVPSSLMMMSKNGKSENVEPVSLILDIPEDGIRRDEQQKHETETDETSTEKSKSSSSKKKKTTTPSETEIVEMSPGDKAENIMTSQPINSEKNFITPFLQLFQRRTRTPKSGQEKDLEAGEVATELLETNNKSSTNSDGNGLTSTKLSSSTSEMKHEGNDEEKTDGEALPKHNEKKLFDELITSETKSGKEDEVSKKSSMMTFFSRRKTGEATITTTPTKPSPTDLWVQRIQERLPKHSKWMLGGILALIMLIIIFITIAALRVNKAIDIGTLIIGGKYINTITSCGRIQGISENEGFVFRGIPYALPPVGELRWRPAKTHQNIHHCWNGTYLAHNHSTPCWQFYRDGSYDGEEDCLYLDLYTPKVYYDTPLPVVVFIGGETLNGGQSSILKPSAALAKKHNVVYVTVSIRRSVLGFLSLDLLTASSYPMTSGNYGLSDLVAALKWVKYNVEHFGGDPDHVTLLGHQSGATLVNALKSSHLAKGLFHQGWVSGGSPLSTLISFQDGEIQNAKYLEPMYLNCTELTCMQNRGPEQLLQHVPYEWRAFHQDLPTKGEVKHHWLVRDGLILRETLQKDSLFPSQQDYLEEKIPFVSGAPAEVDASPEMFSYLNWNDTSKFSAYLESKLGSFGPSLSREVSDRYFKPETTPWQQFVSLLSDVRTICPLYFMTLAMADEFVKTPTYFYVATQRKFTSIGYVADENIDIAAIFGVYEAETREEKKFVQNMEKLFYEFVKKGKFPDEQDVTKSIYIVDENILKTYTYANCDFWQQHNFYPNYSRVD